MFDKIFSPEVIEETLKIVQREIPLALWETFYVTLLSTLFAVIIGLPLGVLLVIGEKDGIRPLPKALMSFLNILINDLLCFIASSPFNTVINIYIPCSVKAYGLYLLPPQLEVKNFDLKIEYSSSLS